MRKIMAIVLIAVQVLTAAGLIVYRHLYDRAVVTKGTEMLFALSELHVERTGAEDEDEDDAVRLTLIIVESGMGYGRYGVLTEGENGMWISRSEEELPEKEPFLIHERMYQRDTVFCPLSALSVIPFPEWQNWKYYDYYDDETGEPYDSGKMMIEGKLVSVQARGYVYKGDVIFTELLFDGETVAELYSDPNFMR
ncbi:MAG: hypothetical protein IJK40_03500 [Clostridia bacterium]|nr:hypothetical protein [Clostridia bacterium]